MAINYKKLAAVAGAAVGALAMKKLMDNYEMKPPKQRTDFDKLIETQLVCDVLDGATLAEWFKNQQETSKVDLIFFIAKPTGETIKMFALDHVPEELDCEHCLLQVAVKKENCEVKAIRMISYNLMNQGIAILLENKDYVIVDGGVVNE